MRFGICVGLAAVLWAAGIPRDVLAGEPPPPKAEGANPSVERAIHRGEAAWRAGRWQEAGVGFRAAWEASGRVEWAGELGLCELALRKHRDAAEHLRLALADPPALPPAQRERFRQGLSQARKSLATASIAVNPAEAEVFLDGRRVGQGRPTYMVDVEPGSHEVRAELPGYREVGWRFEAQRGDRPMVPLTLDPLPAPPPPPRTAVAVAPAPAPLPWTAPPPGVDLGRVVRIGGVAFAATSVLLGGVLGIAAALEDGEAEAQREAIRADAGGRAACANGTTRYETKCAAMKEATEARDALATAAWTSVAVGATFGAVALSSLWWAPSPARGEVRVSAAAGADGGVVWIRGSW